MKVALLKGESIDIIDFEIAKNIFSKDELKKYKEFIPSEQPSYDEEYQIASVHYIESENKIFEKWKVVNNIFKIESRIQRLKNELSSTDYIVTKTYEAKLSMSDAPYSQEFIDETIQSRQVLRDKINELEKLLK